jgi:hypothetical protein
VGLSTTVAVPKITLTIGLPSALSSVLPSSDLGGPYATRLIQANLLATGATTMVQCEKRELNRLVVVGYTPGLLGKLKLKPQSKTILDETYTEVRPANITLCKNQKRMLSPSQYIGARRILLGVNIGLYMACLFLDAFPGTRGFSVLLMGSARLARRASSSDG